MKLDRGPVRRTIRMCRSGGQGSPGWGFRRRLHPGLYSSRSFAAEVFVILTGANEMAAVRPGPARAVATVGRGPNGIADGISLELTDEPEFAETVFRPLKTGRSIEGDEGPLTINGLLETDQEQGTRT